MPDGSETVVIVEGQGGVAQDPPEGQESSQDPAEKQAIENRALQAANDRLRAELAAATEQFTAAQSQASDAAAEAETLRATVQAGELNAHRAELLARNPDVVPGLVQGDTAEALDASVEAARAEYQRIRGALETELRGTEIPAGAPGRQSDAERLAARAASMTPEQKVSEGLKLMQGG